MMAVRRRPLRVEPLEERAMLSVSVSDLSMLVGVASGLVGDAGTADYGDAPDTTIGAGVGDYNTLLTDNGPSHTVLAGLYMGAAVDGDTGTLQNAAANADDVDQSLPDDEDGLVNPTRDLTFTFGAQPTVNVIVSNTTDTEATLSGWIDYNGNGIFDNYWERAQATIPAGTTNEIVSLTFPVLRCSYTETTYARFRLSTDPAAEEPIGPALDGEVEDYIVTIYAPSTGIVESKTKIASGTPGMSTLNDYDLFGNAVTQIGDLDGDGVVDLAVGATGDDTGGDRRGALHVLFMNADGTVKSTQEIASETGGGPVLSNLDFLGTSLDGIGDLDGDGVTDMAVAAHNADIGGTGRGAVHVLFMNTDGTVKSSQLIAHDTGGGPLLSDNDNFGSSLASLGDIDGDGVTDLAIGADRNDTSGADRGAVHILFMNSDGTVKNTQKIADSVSGGPFLMDSDKFGTSVAPLGDLNGDGVTDLAVGARDDDTGGGNMGAIYLLTMNSDGTVAGSQKIAHNLNGGPTLSLGDRFGGDVVSLGDLNGDGVAELVVGAWGDDIGGTDTGAVHILFMEPEAIVVPTVLYVDADSTYDPLAGDSGTSWATAVADLQDALDLAAMMNIGRDPTGSVQEIWIAEGLYTPTRRSDADGDGIIDDNDRSKTFILIDGTAIYGGFAGDESDLASRHGSETILSGDLNGDDSFADNNTDNAYTVVTALNLEQTTVLDRITITGGDSSGYMAAYYPRRSGGGIYLKDSVPEDGDLILRDVIITGNNVDYKGGGIYSQGQLTILDSIIEENTADYGGGIADFDSSLLSIENSMLLNNVGQINITNSTIACNSAETAGGVIQMSQATASAISINNSIIAQNYASKDKCDLSISINKTIDGHNNLIGISGDGVVLVNGEDGNIVGTFESPIDPFVDADMNDFRLVEGSPAVDGGDTQLAVYTDATPIVWDLRGDPHARVQGTSVDMGALEGAGLAIPAQTYMVDSLRNAIAVDGILTLAEAIAASNANAVIGDAPAGSPMEQDVINFTDGLSGMIHLTGTELYINGDLIINGPGTETLTINANNLSRIFRMEDLNLNNWDAPQVQISGLTLTEGTTEIVSDLGYDRSGGAIWSNADLTLQQMLVTNNTAEHAGGGIFNRGELTVSDSTISNNEGDYGGGISNSYGELTVVHSALLDNEAREKGGGINSSHGMMTLVDSAISGNDAKFGGGFENYEGTAYVSGSVFTHNTARISKGGGIRASFCDLTLMNSLIADNSTPRDGGGLYAFSSVIHVMNSTIANNSAEYGGGAYIDSPSYRDDSHIDNTIIVSNASTYTGNDIYYDYSPHIGDLYLSHSLIGNINGTSEYIDDGGNIMGKVSDPIDPRFFNSAADDYRLRIGSPAINTGDTSLLPADENDLDDDGDTTEPLPFDIDGDIRVFAGIVDMGAYEATDLGYDFGDAPDPTYPTLLASDGARHYPVGPTLGALRDVDQDGLPTPNADSDDVDGDADEDGLISLAELAPGLLDVQLEVQASAASFLNAWIDFNANGVWEASEHIAVESPLVAGANQILFDVPLSAQPSATYVRLRLTSYNTGGTLLPTGLANDGEVEDHLVYITNDITNETTANDDVVRFYPGTPGGARHRVSINGGAYMYYDATDIDTIRIDGLAGNDTLSIYGKATDETATFNETSVQVSESSVYDFFGDDFENIYVYSGGGLDTAIVQGTTGNDDLYINEGYSYLRGDSSAFLNYTKGFDSVTFDAAEGGTDRAYMYDGTGDDMLTAGETQATVDYDSTGSPGVNVTAIGFDEFNAYAVNGGNDTATLTGSAGNDRFTARDLYGRMKGDDGAYIHYAEGFDQVTGDTSGTTGTDIAVLFDAEGDDRLEAGETTVSLDLDATPGVDDFDLVATGFDQTYTYAVRGGNNTALMTGSDSADRFTSKRTYSVLKRRDGAYFHYAAGWNEVTVDVSGGAGPDLAFIYDDTTDDAFEAGPTQATIDYDATPGSPDIDTTAIGFGEVYAYADFGGNDTAILNGSTGVDKFYGLTSYSYIKANDNSFYAYARGFDAVTANAVGSGDLAFMYGSDGDDLFDAGSESATFTLNPTSGSQIVNTASAFDQVYGYATGGGTDAANLTGTTADDYFKGDADWGYLRSKGSNDYFNYVRYFDEVFADPGDTDIGNDDLDDLGVSYALDSTPGNSNAW